MPVRAIVHAAWQHQLRASKAVTAEAHLWHAMQAEEAAAEAIAPQAACIAAPNSDTPAGSPPGPRPGTPPHDAHVSALLARSPIEFIGTPGPLLKPLQCYIVREKAHGGLLKKAPHVYKLYAEAGDVFLLAAQRRARTKAPSYIVSTEKWAFARGGPSYYGKIKVCCGLTLVLHAELVNAQ